MSTATASQSVDVVVTPDAQGTMSIMIDPCLDSLGVGRIKALNEMLAPGIHTGLDSTSDELQFGAALINQLYRKTDQNQHARDLIDFLIAGDFIQDTGVILSDGLQAAGDVKVTYWTKDARGNDVKTESDLATRGIKTAKSAIVKRSDCYMLSPNVQFLDDAALSNRLDVSKDDLMGDSFYVPTVLATGALAPCTIDDSKQSTKIRVLLPNGYEFLVAWMRLNDRTTALKSDKW